LTLFSKDVFLRVFSGNAGGVIFKIIFLLGFLFFGKLPE